MTRVSVLFLITTALSGCVGFASDKAKVNNTEIIAYELASQIQTGDSLARLTQIMGPPTSSGIDLHGKPYLRYAMIEHKTKAATVQILGFVHASTYNYPTGYELQVFYEGNTITAISQKRYVSEPGDNSP